MNKKIKYFIMGLLCVLLAVACQKSDAEKDYGFPVIYMPQATITGLDNTYPIPYGPIGQNSVYSCRYNEGDGVLEIPLGVIRAGYINNAKGFSVSLGVSQEQTDAKLATYISKSVPACALPLDCCSIPESIVVNGGKNSGTCYVGVDVQKLSAMSLYNEGKYPLLVLALAISDPTEYELAEENTSVAIVLDFNSNYWNDIAENLPESAIRDLFPIY